MTPPRFDTDNQRQESEDSLAEAIEQRDARRRARAARSEGRTDPALVKAARVWEHMRDGSEPPQP